MADLDLVDAPGPAFLKKVGGTYLSGVGGGCYLERSVIFLICFDATLGGLDFDTVCLFVVDGPFGLVLLSMDIAAAAAADKFPDTFGFTTRGFLGTAAVSFFAHEVAGGAGGAAVVWGGFGGEGSSESR